MCRHLRSDEVSKRELKELVGQKLEKDELGQSSFLTQYRLFQSKAFYFQLIGETEKVFHHFSKVLDLWDEYPKIKKEKFYNYIITLSNLINSSIAQKKFQYALPFIERLETETPSNTNDKTIVFYKSSLFRLLYYMNLGSFIEAKKITPDIELGIQKHNLSDKARTVLISNIITLNFILEDYEVSIKWMNKIISRSKLRDRQDIQRYIRMLSLVAYSEIGEVEKFENTVRSTSYFLKTRKQSSPDRFEMKVLSYLKKINNLPPLERKELLLDFLDYLERTKKSPSGLQPLGLDELYFWAKSKIEKKPIINLIKGNS